MQRYQNWFLGIALVAITLLAYQPAWNGKPLMDDTGHLVTTRELRSLNGLASLWIHPATVRQYHPLLDTVYWVEANLWGQATPGYHLLTILLHAASALLLVKILRKLEVPGAWLAAAIFALHPVQVESVAWMIELKNTLSGIFFFGCVLVYLRFDAKRTWQSYALVLLLFMLGVSAKAIVAMFPAVMLVLLWWKRGRLNWSRDVKPLLPFVALGIAAGLFTAWMERAFSGAEGEKFEFSMLDRFLIAGRAFWFYFGKLFWPSNLSLFYPRWNIDRAMWWQYLFPIAALCLFGLAWTMRRQCRWLLAGLVLFGVLLLPMLGFFNVNFFRFSFVADHFQYLPSIGIITPLSAGGAILLTRLRGWQRAVGCGLCLALLAMLAAFTWRQSQMYRSPEIFYRTIIERNPNSSDAYINFGYALFEKGSTDEAIANFQKVLEINPNDTVAVRRAHLNIGNVLLQKRLVDEAIVRFQKALEIDGNYAKAHVGLATAFHRKGRLQEAIAHYEKAVELAPRFAIACDNLAWMLAACPDASLRNGSRAVELAEQAVRLSGGTDPVNLRTLAAAYAETGQFSKAVEIALRASQLAAAGQKTALVGELRKELALYEAALPYHERAL